MGQEGEVGAARANECKTVGAPPVEPCDGEGVDQDAHMGLFLTLARGVRPITHLTTRAKLGPLRRVKYPMT